MEREVKGVYYWSLISNVGLNVNDVSKEVILRV
jgi:hypothetical protein